MDSCNSISIVDNWNNKGKIKEIVNDGMDSINNNVITCYWDIGWNM